MLCPRHLGVALGLTLLVLALTSQAALAASITVTTTNDEAVGATNGRCALREAIVNANNNNTTGSVDCTAGAGDDTITLPAGTFRVTLGGAGATQGDLDLNSNITIVGAGPGQTIVDATGLNDRVFDVGSGATVTISGVTIQHGNTTGDGGGLRVDNGTVTLRDVLIAENTAEDGGGVKVETNRTLTMIRTSIRGNTSTSDGGGIFNQGTTTMSDGDLSGNHAQSDGGAMRNDTGATMTMTRVVVRANIADDTSGGIENRGTLRFSDGTIDGNAANGGDGGGMQNQAGASLTLVRSAITRNVTAEDGGGIDFDGGTASLTNVTISGNTAAVDGGGLEGSDGASVTMLHVTIADNTAAHGSGIFNDPAPPASITLRSTLIANNARGANCAGAAVTSNEYNLEFPGTTCNLNATGDLHGADPRLGPLANNGGPSQTHAFVAASPAVDGATNTGCPPNDQRGEPRPVNGDGDGVARCDIGAYEQQVGQTRFQNVPSNNDDDGKKKETEEQRQQRERTNNSNRSDYQTEGNVLAVERGPEGASLLVTIGLVKNETLVVQIACIARGDGVTCPDIRVGDYLEADGYQNGIGDPNAYFIAEDFTVLRGGKKVKQP